MEFTLFGYLNTNEVIKTWLSKNGLDYKTAYMTHAAKREVKDSDNFLITHIETYKLFEIDGIDPIDTLTIKYLRCF